MPFMITNPAQQSTNRTTTRSELSGNWRTKIDAPPREGNDAASPTPARPTGRDYLQQRNDKLNRDNVKRSAITAPRPSPRESVRGEDDPRTIQAIAEGRRLYVGNMSYMAKSKDVRALFSEGSYSVFGSPCHSQMAPCIEPMAGNMSTCRSTLSQGETHPTALSSLQVNRKQTKRWWN